MSEVLLYDIFSGTAQAALASRQVGVDSLSRGLNCITGAR